MNGIELVIGVCFILEGYLILIGIISCFKIYYYYKDGNKKGINLKGRVLRSVIRHELVHARIANKFGFIDWKIIHKSNSLVCEIYMNDATNWGSLFKFLTMCGFHFIFDMGAYIVWVDVLNICVYIKKYFLDIRRITNKFIRIKKEHVI